jgi:signal transduction histidine kinase
MKEKALQVLLVEDNAGDARLLREMFSKERADGFELTHLLRMSDAVLHLAKGGVDIALLDLGLPDAHGLDTVRRALEVAPHVPVIVLTGLDDETLAAEAMKEGAQDYLIKGQIESRALPRALRHAIERHRMQIEADQIKQLQLQLKDDFLSHVSHELRSPLTAIYQFGTILADGLAGKTKPEQQEYLQIILRNVRQLKSMIDDLLEATRAQTGKFVVDPQCASVSDAIVDATNTLQGAALAKEIAISFDLSTPVPSAYADPTRLRQILLILLDNAIKFTPQGGAVKVQAQVFEKVPTLLLLEVSDSGCGISPDMTERIFDRLYQVTTPSSAGRKGLGLGLYICKELVTLQGGQIWAQSAPGQGSVLSFTLPVFSLDNLIGPLLRNEAWPAPWVGLMTVGIGSKDGWLSQESREEWSRETRILIQSCLLPNLDVLLPKMNSGGAEEVFFVVVFADDTGAAVLAKRIHEQFGKFELLKQAGLTLSVAYTFLGPAATEPPASIQDTVGKMAARFREQIKSEIHTRSIHGE